MSHTRECRRYNACSHCYSIISYCLTRSISGTTTNQNWCLVDILLWKCHYKNVCVHFALLCSHCTDTSCKFTVGFVIKVLKVVVSFCLPQSFAWASSTMFLVNPRVPFVVDVCRGTFEQLDQLLRQVCVGLEGNNDWPPPQETECLAVAGLNLLNLQVSLTCQIMHLGNLIYVQLYCIGIYPYHFAFVSSGLVSN